ncbi:tetratricopeptide repeat protein [Alistipes sp. OttesenSCG-928-B03]|nr:tetratricopeptide repeat protein [Alistipes sp. OttesenSCG-928-B03]
MKIAELKPTPNNTHRIEYGDGPGGVACDFGAALRQSQRQEADGDIEGACNTRFAAFQQLMELVPDSTDLELEWEDEASREAMLLINFSAIDHFLVGDFEMCAAMLEMLLELDPEDHFEASKRLAYAYVALEEWELFDEVINDISDKYPEKGLLTMWSEYRRTGEIPEGELRRFRRSFGTYFNELVADEHPVDAAYIEQIAGERPPREALARELWLETEHLWILYPGFIEALRSKAL